MNKWEFGRQLKGGSGPEGSGWQYADLTHLVDSIVPVVAMVVPAEEPKWNYQPGQNAHQRRDLIVRCLLQGMEMFSNKVDNFDKLHKITQRTYEKSSHFPKPVTGGYDSVC